MSLSIFCTSSSVASPHADPTTFILSGGQVRRANMLNLSRAAGAVGSISDAVRSLIEFSSFLSVS
jgi:hypothetical protein